MWKCEECKKRFSWFKPSSVVNNLCLECFDESFRKIAKLKPGVFSKLTNPQKGIEYE